MKAKKCFVLFSALVLFGCSGEESEPEEIEDTQEEVVENESNEENEEETGQGNNEEGQDIAEEIVMPDPVQYEVTTYIDEIEEEVTITVEAGPVFVEDDHAILPIVLDSDSDTAFRFNRALPEEMVFYDNTNNQFDIRLIDPVERTVSHMGIFSWAHETFSDDLFTPLTTFISEGDSPHERSLVGGEGYAVHLFTVFDAPQSDDVHVFLGRLGLVENVPVVTREETTIPTLAEVSAEFEDEEIGPEERVDSKEHFIYGVPTLLEVVQQEVSNSAVAEDPEEYLESIQFRTMPLEVYSESLESSVSRVDEIEHSTLILSSDVLFDFDDSTLTEEADAELEAAIAELEGVDGGELQIVGHTDNEHTEEYNQELSEDRAEAVHNRLNELMNFEVFDEVTTRGESFREPIADNDSAEGRARNRRVELHFTPPTEQIVVESETEIPETEGVEVTYPEHADTQYGSVEIESVKRVDDFFVGRIKVHGKDGTIDREALQQRMSGEVYGARGMTHGDHGYETRRVDGVTILHNGRRYYPIDYYVETLEGTEGESFEERQEGRENEREYILPLSDRFLANSGDYFHATVVWPALATDSVIIDLEFPEMSGDEERRADQVERLAPWRILDVPVEGNDSAGSVDTAEDSDKDEVDEENDE